MKRTLMKTIMIAALLFCSGLQAKAKNCMAALKKAKTHQSFTACKSLQKHQFVHMYAMQNSENLKAYHISAKFFNPSHKVSTAMDLADSIKSHPFFIGSFANEPSKEEYISLKAKINYPFFFFEAYQDGKSEFYMGNPKGLRHFSINNLDDRTNSMASICNSISQNYPGLDRFIKCTIESHSDKYLI